MENKKRVINYYIYLLSKRDYTVQELSDKALDKGYSSGEINEAIAQLKEINYVNDRRFVEVAINTYRGIKGFHWIVQKLRRRKVPNPIIESELEEVDFSPSEAFLEKVKFKYRVDKFSDLEFKEKTKIVNYISRQGFPNAYGIVKEWESGEQ